MLSNIVNYIWYDKHPKNFHNLNIRAVKKEKCKRKSNVENEERQMLELYFGDTPQKLKDYLDVYEGIQSEILNTARFDQSSDLSTTYLESVNTTKLAKSRWKNHS